MTVNQTLLFEGAIIVACLYSFIVLIVVPLAKIDEKIRINKHKRKSTFKIR